MRCFHSSPEQLLGRRPATTTARLKTLSEPCRSAFTLYEPLRFSSQLCPQHTKVPGQGMNPHHSSDNTRSLTDTPLRRYLGLVSTWRSCRPLLQPVVEERLSPGPGLPSSSWAASGCNCPASPGPSTGSSSALCSGSFHSLLPTAGPFPGNGKE